MSDIPWAPKTQQEKGLHTEKDVVKKAGGKVHPRSGAGSIKDDGSTPTEQIEVKHAFQSHTVSGRDLLALFKRATRRGKTAKYIIYFESADITLEGTLRKGRG